LRTVPSLPSITVQGTAGGLDPVLGLATAAFNQTVVLKSPNRIKGTFTFTAQDGSTLTGAYHGPASPPNNEGLTAGRGEFTVTGGSGRFAQATGNGRYTVSAQLFGPSSDPSATVATEFEGDIVIPRRRR
jgi:hypothetical protein